VARSGEASAAIRAEHTATSASARRASAWVCSSSSGMPGMVRATRSSARATTAPSAAGSSASSANRRPSSKYHQPSERERVGSTTFATVAFARGRLDGGSLRTRPPGPHEQSLFGARRREPRQLRDLVDAELAGRERLRDPRQPFQGVGGRDPPARLPLGDAVADGQEVRRIARALLPPCSRSHQADDRGQQLAMRGPTRATRWLRPQHATHRWDRTCVRIYTARSLESVNLVTLRDARTNDGDSSTDEGATLDRR
jgi:hypothetical protein